MLAQAALSYLHAPFRLHGRSREEGLDCVGLLACAMSDSGFGAVLPQGYGLRNRAPGGHLACLAASGFTPQPHSSSIKAGDVLITFPGPAQQHLLIACSPDRFVHAHAGLRRVALATLPLPWPVAQQWRLQPGI